MQQYHIKNRTDTKALCIFFHGYGASGQNVYPVLEFLEHHTRDSQGKNLFSFWAPDAPARCGTYPEGREWFNLHDVNFYDNRHHAVLSQRMHNACEAWISQHQHFFSQPVIFMGFSQGACFAYHAALQCHEALGVVGFSGFYPSWKKPRFTPPALWVHGDQDDVVPVSWMHHASRTLDFPFETYEDIGVTHTMSPQGLKKACDFLKGLV